MKYKKRKRQCKSHDDLVEHFQRRCLDRVGTILSQRALKELFTTRKLKVLGKQSNTRTLFILRKEHYPKQELKSDLVLVYDKLRHAFVTVMNYLSWQSNHDENLKRI